MFSNVLTLHTEKGNPESCIGSIQISDNAKLFDEHFPENPILPGAFSLISAYQLLKEYFLLSDMNAYELKKIIKVDFIFPISPGVNLTMRLKKLNGNNMEKNISFVLVDINENVFLRGSLLIGVKK